MITAEDVMSEDVSVIYEDMPLRQVAHLMLRNRVSGYPVVNHNIGLVGIITMTDLFLMIDMAFNEAADQEFSKALARFKNLNAGNVMSKNVVTISPKTTMDEIVRLVAERGIHVFPVVENDKLVGIVSRHDILNATFSYD